jgi:hypothetical protein
LENRFVLAGIASFYPRPGRRCEHGFSVTWAVL